MGQDGKEQKGIGTAAALGAKDAKALAAEVCPISPPQGLQALQDGKSQH